MRWAFARVTARTHSDRHTVIAFGGTLTCKRPMFRWIIVIFLALVLISWFTPLLQRLGLGRLPGDFRFKLFGREFFFPVTTTVLLSLVAGAIAKFI